MEKLQLITENWETIAIIVTSLIAFLTQVAAALGKPEFIEKVGVVSKVWDALAGNYGKAKNAEESK